MLYKSLCVVITDWGDLRDQIFSRTGFAPSDIGLPETTVEPVPHELLPTYPCCQPTRVLIIYRAALRG